MELLPVSNAITNLCRPLRLAPPRKCVLMALADRADDNGIAWPSITWICEWTCFGRTAVIAALKGLEELGFVVLTKEQGRNNRCEIVVAEIKATIDNQSASRTGDAPEGPSSKAVDPSAKGANQSATRTGPPAEPVRQTDSGVSATRTGTSPPPEPTSPPDGPDTSINIIKTSKKTDTKKVAFDPCSVELPDWMPMETWSMWVRYRVSIKKPMNEDATRLQLRRLGEYRAKGEDPVKVVEHSITSGWQGAYPSKQGETRACGAGAGTNKASTTSRHTGFAQRDYGEAGDLVDMAAKI